MPIKPLDEATRHAERWQQHVDANRAWVDGRYRAAALAFTAIAGRQDGLANSVTWAAAREAGNAAAAQYERDVPRPTFNGRATEVLHHVGEEEAAT